MFEGGRFVWRLSLPTVLHHANIRRLLSFFHPSMSDAYGQAARRDDQGGAGESCNCRLYISSVANYVHVSMTFFAPRPYIPSFILWLLHRLPPSFRRCQRSGTASAPRCSSFCLGSTTAYEEEMERDGERERERDGERNVERNGGKERRR